MDVWAKLFEVDGHQLLVETATDWEDDIEQDKPVLVFRIRNGGVEAKQTIFFNEECTRDEVFAGLEQSGLATKWAQEMKKILCTVN